jgi:hypothetical protein
VTKVTDPNEASIQVPFSSACSLVSRASSSSWRLSAAGV